MCYTGNKVFAKLLINVIICKLVTLVFLCRLWLSKKGLFGDWEKMSVFCNIFYFITISRVHWIATSDIVFLLNEVAVSFIKLRGEKVIQDLFRIWKKK